MELPQFLAGVGCGLCVGLSIVAFRNFGATKSKLKTITKFISRSEYKMVLVVRTDLKMTKGKIAAQCGHAAVGGFESAQREDPDGFLIWRNLGQAKVALKANSLEEVETIANNAKEMGIITTEIRDDGRTQVSHNTLTVLGVGPAPKEIIDKVTGHLKLL